MHFVNPAVFNVHQDRADGIAMNGDFRIEDSIDMSVDVEHIVATVPVEKIVRRMICTVDINRLGFIVHLQFNGIER